MRSAIVFVNVSLAILEFNVFGFVNLVRFHNLFKHCHVKREGQA